MKSKQIAVTAAGLSLAAALAGCSAASYDERRAYLDKTAQRGVATHERMVAQGGQIDKERCEAAFKAMSADDVPFGGFDHNGEWVTEVQKTYVDACLSGTAATPTPSATPSPSGSAGSTA